MHTNENIPYKLSCDMKVPFVWLVLMLALSSCTPDDESIKIDFEKLDDNEILLSAIADGITYIPLDNNYPMSIYFQKIDIFDDTIYLNEKDNGMLAFTMSGKMVRSYGSRGRGPGEYVYGLRFTIDRNNRILYLLDMKNILKYSLDGNYLGKISLEKYPGHFTDLRFQDSLLIVFEFIALGEAVYDWIVIDTDGNPVMEKYNYVPSFESTFGPGGGIYEFDSNIYYWNGYNDTVFSVHRDLSYNTSFLFTPSDLRWPRNDIEPDLMPEYIGLNLVLETKRFIVIKYFYKESTLAFIEKADGRSYKVKWKPVNHIDNNGGIMNDIDGGAPFDPKHYFEEDGIEYLIGYTQPVNILTSLRSEDFNHSVPRYPEKKEALYKMSEKLKETDNAVLTIVRLKK